MAKNPTSQLSLDPLFDSTAISSLTLDGGFSRPSRSATVEEAPLFQAPKPVVAQTRIWRLRGSRDLAPSWKERAANTIAAIRLLLDIEGAGGSEIYVDIYINFESYPSRPT